MDGKAHGVEVELEEDAGNRTRVDLQLLHVVRYRVLVGMQGGTAWSNVSGGDHMHVILVGDETYEPGASVSQVHVTSAMGDEPSLAISYE